jgi:hypothetical protein
MIDAKSLLNYNRWDIIIKYVYIKYFDLYCKHYPKLSESDLSNELNTPELRWFRNLYMDHLRVLNGGYEVSAPYQEIEKKTLEDFLNSFHSLYFSIKNKGFDNSHPIPVGYNNTIINGAHRIAISCLFNLKIPIQKINTGYSTLKLPPDSFNNRSNYNMPISNQLNVISGLSIEQQEFILKTYIQINSKHLRFLVIYNHNINQNHETYLKKYLKDNHYHIIHQKDIVLNIYGTFQFIKHLYFNEPKVNVTLKTAHAYFAHYHNKIPKQFTTRVYLIESNDFSSLSPSGASSKIHLRHHYNSDHSLHVTDNPDETIFMGNLIYHQTSIDYLNLLPLNHHPKIDELFITYMKIIKKYENNNSNSFTIVSSFLLGLLGIRIPSDLDFIYDDNLINNQNLERFSHNKYKEYYPKIFSLLYNPKYYFYYFSLKVTTLEELRKMKIIRKEDKDILDIQSINHFYKYNYLRTQFSIITTTHAIPSAPSTRIIEMCLKSFYENFPGAEFVHHWIYFDSREDKVSLEYWDNLQKLRDTYPNLILIKEPCSGLKHNYLKGLKNVITPFFMFLEHDWIFLEKVNLLSILNEFTNKTDLHYLRFNKRDNYQKGGWDQHLIKDDTIKGFTAIKTDNWGNQPHIVRREKWFESWFNIVTHPKLNTQHSTFGIEDILYRVYQYEINQLGFEKAHQKWGCYNYGTKSGKHLIEHIDGSEKYNENTMDGRHIKIDF